MGIKILLADSHQITREGISLMLSNHAEMEVVVEGKSGQEVVDLVSKVTPDVVIMDVAPLF